MTDILPPQNIAQSLRTQTRDDLNIIARKLKIPRYRRMGKEELLSALQAVDPAQLAQVLHIRWWDRYQVHAYGIGGVAVTVVLFLISYLLPPRNTEPSSLWQQVEKLQALQQERHVERLLVVADGGLAYGKLKETFAPDEHPQIAEAMRSLETILGDAVRQIGTRPLEEIRLEVRFAKALILGTRGEFQAVLDIWQPGDTQSALGARVHEVRGDALSALQRWEEAASEYEQAMRAGRNTPFVNLNRGVCQYRAGRPSDAVLSYTETIRACTAASPKNPEEDRWNRISLAIALNNRGVVRRKQGDFVGALVDLREATDLLRDVVSERRHERWSLFLGSALTTLGDARLGDSRADAAVDSFGEAMNIYIALLQISPVKGLAVRVGQSRHNVAVAFAAGKRYSDALMQFQMAVQTFRLLLEQYGPDPDISFELANSLTGSATAALNAGRADEAAKDYQESIGILENGIATAPDRDRKFHLGMNYLHLAYALADSGRQQEALAAADRAAVMFEELGFDQHREAAKRFQEDLRSGRPRSSADWTGRTGV